MDTVAFRLGSPANVATGWTLAIVSEGYTTDELRALFESDVTEFLEVFLNTPPFDDSGLRPALNVVEIRVASAKSGKTITIVPGTTAATPSPFDTAWGAMYGRESFNGQQVTRSLWGNSKAVKDFVRGLPGLKDVDGILVLVNSSLHGGTRDEGVAWSAKGPGWPDKAIHELGHQAFDLADEYPSYGDELTDPLRDWPGGTEPTAPNVTTDTNITRMKWGDLITLPQRLVPTTVVTSPCVRLHPVRMEEPPIPSRAIGAYEGADYFDCGLFRPSAACKMREYGDPFCRVCEQVARARIGHHMLKSDRVTSFAAGRWTHVQTFANAERTLAYDTATGAYAISPSRRYFNIDRRPDGSPPLDPENPARGTGSLGPGWTWLVPFTLAGRLHYFAHQFGSGVQGIFQMNADDNALNPTWTSPPGVTWTHVLTLTLLGAPHVITYNSLTGDAALLRLDASDTAPVLVTTMEWGAWHTALLSVSVSGEPYVLTYRVTTGEVMIRHITAAGFVMAYASPSGFWLTITSHLASVEINGRPYVLRYSSIDGTAALWHVRGGGTGIDFVKGLTPGPGLDPLSLLGSGTSPMGVFAIPTVTGTTRELFFYNAATQTLTTGWVLSSA